MPRLKSKTGLSLRRGLSVQLKGSIELLSLNNLELGKLLQKELELNPFLEEKSPAEFPEAVAGSDERSLVEREVPEGTDTSFEQISRGLTLQEHLLEQVSTATLSALAGKLVKLFISAIDEEGFTRRSHEEIAGAQNVSPKIFTEALDFIKTLDPCGVCARDVWESLEWQAEIKYPGDHLLLDVISAISSAGESLEELSPPVTKELASVLLVKTGDIKKKLKLLATLKPHPAAGFNQKASRYIFPDLIYSFDGKNISVQLSNAFIPEVTLNSELLEISDKEKMSDEWTAYYKSAQELLRGVAYRNSTLLKIGMAVARKQPAFFQHGEDAIVPLGLKDIAKEVGVHISTVSRVVSEKYCLTSFGVTSLKVFFSRKIKSNRNLNLSPKDLQRAITEIIQDEPPENPCSDAVITEILRKKGYDIQRRTVAKYRKLLHIPSINKRKVSE